MNNFQMAFLSVVLFCFLSAHNANASEICRGVPRRATCSFILMGNTDITGNDHQKIASSKQKKCPNCPELFRTPASSRKCSIKVRASGTQVHLLIIFRNVCGPNVSDSTRLPSFNDRITNGHTQEKWGRKRRRSKRPTKWDDLRDRQVALRECQAAGDAAARAPTKGRRSLRIRVKIPTVNSVLALHTLLQWDIS